MKHIKFFTLSIFLIAIFTSGANNVTKKTEDKVAIGVVGESPIGINSKINDRFAKSPYFVLLPISDNKIDKSDIVVVKNKYLKKDSGVGVAVVKMLKEHNVISVITPNIGENAFQALKDKSITVYKASDSVIKAVEAFNQKQLEQITSPTKKLQSK